MTDIENNAGGGLQETYPGGYFRKSEDADADLPKAAKDIRDLVIGTVEAVDRIGKNIAVKVISSAALKTFLDVEIARSMYQPDPIPSSRTPIQGGHYVVERQGEHFLSITDNEYGCDNDFLPISKTLHDLIAAELGTGPIHPTA